jgi:hypothetical protein
MLSKYNSLVMVINHLKAAQKTKIKSLQIKIKRNGTLSYKIQRFLNSVLNVLLTWGYLFGHKFLLCGALQVILKYSNSIALIQKTKMCSVSPTVLVRVSHYNLVSLIHKNPQSLFVLEVGSEICSGSNLVKKGLGGILLLQIN